MEPTSHPHPPSPQRWHLKLGEEPFAPAKQAPWQLKDLYLSSVALAAHLTLAEAPQTVSPAWQDQAKAVLKRLLMQISLCASEAGYLLPVVGILEISTSSKTTAWQQQFKIWERDQDWHRGQFLLFTTLPEEVNSRLVDILGPQPLQLHQDFAPRTSQDILTILDANTEVPPELRELLHVAHKASRQVVRDRGEERKQRIRQTFQRWLQRQFGDLQEPYEAPGHETEGLAQPALPMRVERNSAERRVTRVQAIEVRHFRGLTASAPNIWNTDADVVLLTGANGTGKSSFLEALLLILTGYFRHDRSSSADGRVVLPATLFSLMPSSDASSSDTSPYMRAPEFRMQATVATVAWDDEAMKSAAPAHITVVGEETAEHVHISNSWNGLWPLPVKRRWSDTMRGDERDYELDARLCGFFQDRVEQLYDENVSGSTIRDVLEPKPLFFDLIEETIKDLNKELDNYYSKIEQRRLAYTTEQVQHITQDFQQWVADFRDLYGQLHRQRPEWPEPLPAIDNFERLVQFCHSIMKQSGRTLSLDGPDVVTNVLPFLREIYQQILRETQRSQSDILRRHPEIEDIEAQLQSIEAQYPYLDEELSWFAVTDAVHPISTLPRRTLVTLLRELQHHVPHWLVHAEHLVSTSGHLHKLLTELAAVQTTAAGICAEELEVWLQPREQVERRRNTLRQRLAELRRQQGEFVPPEHVRQIAAMQDSLEQRLQIVHSFYDTQRWQQDVREQEAQLRQIDAARQDLERLTEAMEQALGASPQLRQTLQESVNAVLGRFAMSKGLEHVVLQELQESGGRRTLLPQSARDGRGFLEFSTGQRAQVAIALMIAQHELIQEALLGHRVLLLDDVSTSYDLSNLSREALLWRQLAYHPDQQYRCQIFIASHHEDLSNHLLDLLAPPGHEEGGSASMRLLKFVDWDPATGPSIQAYTVQPAPASNVARPQQTLMRLLKESLG